MKYKLSHFNFDLPTKLIPQNPEQRDESKLMVLYKSTGKIEHKKFKDLIEYFNEDDVMVFNNTKVFPAGCMEIRKKLERESRCFY